MYVGETKRLFKVRKKEHQNKVRWTIEDVSNGRLTTAEERMGKEDGGLARYSVDCEKGIDWENAQVLGVENRLRQRILREQIKTTILLHSTLLISVSTFQLSFSIMGNTEKSIGSMTSPKPTLMSHTYPSLTIPNHSATPIFIDVSTHFITHSHNTHQPLPTI